MRMDNPKKLLIVLTLILAVMLAYRVFNPLEQATVAKLTYGRTNKIASSATNANGSPGTAPPTRAMAHLSAVPEPLGDEVYRDPFRRPVGKDSNVARPAPTPPPAPRIATPDERAREQLGRFKTFGTFRQNGRESLFLQRGKQILVVNVGARIDGQYEIQAINGPTVVIMAPGLPQPFEFKFDEIKSEAGNRPGRSVSSLTEATSSPSASSGDVEDLPPPVSDQAEEPPPEDDTEEAAKEAFQAEEADGPTSNQSLSKPLPAPREGFPGSLGTNTQSFTPDQQAE